jgi:hypothetical protein
MNRVVLRCYSISLKRYPVAAGHRETFDDDIVCGDVNILDVGAVGDEFDRGAGDSRLGQRQVGISEVFTRKAQGVPWRGGLQSITHIV